MLLKFCTQQRPKDRKKVSFHSNPKERQCQEWSNYCTIVLISHSSKVMLKILQTRLKQHVNWELADVQVGFWKGRGLRDQITNIPWIVEKARRFQKITSTSTSLTMLKPWLCGSQQTGKFLKRWEYQTTLPTSWEICMQVKKPQLEPDRELVPNWDRHMSRLYIITLLI